VGLVEKVNPMFLLKLRFQQYNTYVCFTFRMPTGLYPAGILV
jgi:hypothetical protein